MTKNVGLTEDKREELKPFTDSATRTAEAGRGIFTTTPPFFRQGTRKDFGSIVNRFILIDGAKLLTSTLMFKYGIGIQKRQVFNVIEVNEDYFESRWT